MISEREKMQFIIFGTGVYYQNLKKYIKNEDIICFVDNNPSKQGTILDGKRIQSPQETDFSKCDYVLVLIMRNGEILKQLTSLGVAEERVKSFYELGQFLNIGTEVTTSKGRVKFSEWHVESMQKSVLIVSHEFTRNGVSVVLMHMALLLKKMGYHVVMTSLIGGGLEKELEERNIDFIPNISMCYRSSRFCKVVESMNFIILGTIGLSDVGNSWKGLGTPIMWWLHESNDKNFQDFPLPLDKNIHYYAGGQRVVDFFYKYYPNGKIEKLLYFLPNDIQIERKEKNELIVATIGVIGFRKAQDIFVEAIKLIPEDKRQNVRFDMVGVIVEQVIDLDKALFAIPQLNYLGELTQEELSEYLKTVDLLVCPSRDDPMPVVVTQAMQYGIPCVISDQVGQSEYIKSGENGYVFKSGDIKELSAILEECIMHPQETLMLGEKSNEIYRNYFSERAMHNMLNQIINDIVTKESNI